MGLSISLAVSLYGISFGALAVASGLTFWQTTALSALMFTGGSQFAFIGVLASGGSGAAAFSGATLLGVRNTIYAVQLNALLNPAGAKKLLAAQVTIDESMATATAQQDPAEQRRGFWVTGVGIWIGWTLATVIGALLGDFIANPEALGLDGAVVAAFLGLLWPRLKSKEPWALAVLAALVTTLTLPLVPPGVPILVAAAVAVVWGLVSARLEQSRPLANPAHAAEASGVEGTVAEAPDAEAASQRHAVHRPVHKEDRS
ncbi:AzlC family ABC transporter permease [Nesterenkonia flava]|uniref:AzlC family ABC transporter permease n=1 Tax=Nesterenkonia flava TaxID=469799 RepID=A0ABU1FTH2_9MICC|nr:AzlC family ABC transporter permease [Nesterenkonia flava]MDR5711944.1 AzlC family ABC transporter permease [Nesterenkonia flava]